MKQPEYECEDCGKKFTLEDGILAEIRENQIVVETCSSYTILTSLCDACVSKRGIKLTDNRNENV